MTFEGINVFCGKKQLLADISGRLVPGTMMLLGGPSGSGKTVFLNALTGRSSLRVQGKISLQPNEFVYVRTHVDFYTRIFTVKEEVWFAAAMYAGGPVSEDRINGLLESVGMTEFNDRLIGELSTGQCKRLSIACALTNPAVRCLILDEPTSNLDSCSAVAIMHAIKDTVRRMVNVSVICSVHQPSSLILSFFDSALLLCRGHSIYNGQIGEPMYEALREYSDLCIDYDTVQFALSQDPNVSSSLYAKWLVKHSITKATYPMRSFRNNLLAYTRSLQSIRLTNVLKFETTNKNKSSYRFIYLIKRSALLFIKDWRRELARIILICVGWVIGAAIVGRPTFVQEDLVHVIASIRTILYLQGMSGVSRVVNRYESDRIAKDSIDNGMYTRVQYESVLFLNTAVAAGLTAFSSAIVSVWMSAPFTFPLWFAIALYFIWVDSMYSLVIRLTGSVNVSAISVLTFLLIIGGSEINSVIIPITQISKYLESVFMSDMPWKPCEHNHICYGGQDACMVLELATLSECDLPVLTTLLSSSIWFCIFVIGTGFIRM